MYAFMKPEYISDEHSTKENYRTSYARSKIIKMKITLSHRLLGFAFAIQKSYMSFDPKSKKNKTIKTGKIYPTKTLNNIHWVAEMGNRNIPVRLKKCVSRNWILICVANTP